MSDEDVDVTVKLKRVAEFNRNARSAAESLDNIGDQARQAGRSLAGLNAASTTTRLNLGPFSTSLRGGALAIGGLIVATKKATPAILSAAEAIVTLTGGGAAAGGVGLLALAQGSMVAKLGMAGLTGALGGSEEAARNLTPEMRDLYDVLIERGKELQGTAQEGMLPGLSRGADRALRNFRVLNRVVGQTSRTLGGLSEDAGGMLGSQAWGGDLGTIGASNARILEDLGQAGLHFADAARHIVVEAGPLTEWLADMTRDGAEFVELWAESARASGDMARFFRDARTDLTLLGSATGHGGRGLINLFGAHDVDGTKTLASLDRIMARFERWTESPAVQRGVGDALVAEIPDAVAAVMDSLARNLPGAAAAAGEVFWDTFWAANTEGKALIAALTGVKIAGAIRGMTRLTPLYVQNVAGPMPTTTKPTTTGKPTGKPTTGGGRGGARGAGAAAIASLVAGEAAAQLPEGPVKNALLGPDTDKIRDEMIAEYRKRHGRDEPQRDVIEIRPQDIIIDGERFARLQANVVVRKRARRAGWGRGGPAGP